MNPLTVALQGVGALVVLIALSLAGHPAPAACIGGGLFLLGAVFQAVRPPKYPFGSRPRFARLPPVTFVLLGLVPLGLLFLSLESSKSKAGRHHPGHVAAVHHVSTMHHIADVLVALAAGAATIYASSLIDEYLVTPRLRGERGNRPCEESKDAGWRSLTQLWLFHRALAYLLVRISLAAAVLIALIASIPKPSTAVTSVIVAVSSLIAGYLLNRATPMFISAINPPFYVGDKVWLVEEYAAGVQPQTCYYAVDVSIDGVGLLELTDSNRVLDREPDQDPDARIGHTHDRIVAIGDMGRLLRARRTFTRCSDKSCCLVNKYCPTAEVHRKALDAAKQSAALGAQANPNPAPAGNA